MLSPWESQSTSALGLIFSDVLTRRATLSPEADIYAQNLDLTKEHLMKSPHRKGNMKYFSLG